METRREVDLSATADEVWACLVDPEALGAWLDGTWQGDVEPGAAAPFADNDGTTRHVLVDAVRDGERTVAWTWWTDDESEPPSSVSIAVERVDDAPGVVRVVVVERQLVVAGPVPRAMAMSTVTA